MRRVIITLGISAFCMMLFADDYSTNKKYTYQEVAEILSEKIIEDRERIVNLEQEINNLKAQVRTNESVTQKKISDTNKSVLEIKDSQNRNINRGNINPAGSQKVSNETIRNIEISTELFNKAK